MVAALAAGIAVLSCCSSVDIYSFRAVDLSRQLEMYKDMSGRNCLGHHGTLYLSAIGEHGVPAAEAMIPFLEKRDDTITPMNALTVMVGAAAVADLRGHPAEAALERFARTTDRDEERRRAEYILAFIRDPSRHKQ